MTIGGVFSASVFKSTVYKTGVSPPPIITTYFDTHDGVYKKRTPVFKDIKRILKSDGLNLKEDLVELNGIKGYGEGKDFISEDEMREMFENHGKEIKAMRKDLDKLNASIQDTLKTMRRLNQDLKDLEKLTNVDLGYKD